MNALAAWGIDSDHDDTPASRRTPAQRAARARSRKRTRERARLLRQARLEHVDALVARLAAGAVRRAWLRDDNPSETEIAHHYVDALRTRFPSSGPFPGTVAAMRGALASVSGGIDCTTAAARIVEAAEGMWLDARLREADRVHVLLAFVAGSPLTGVVIDDESIFGDLAAAGLLERDGGAWRTTEAGRGEIVSYVGRK